jgi:hypothetical protein
VTPEEYAAAQALIVAQSARYVNSLGGLFVNPLLKIADWLGLLNLLFPQVAESRRLSAELGRRFYDSQRKLSHPQLPRHDVYLESYDFRRFVKDMDPARERMSKETAPQDAVTNLVLQSTRVVENAGRQQIIHALRDDPTPNILKGWARVATGRETCAWCLMLVSRGPVYENAKTAGLNLIDEEAVRRSWAYEDDDVSDHMEEWHPGCDCLVVPVFKSKGWPGEEEADRASELWSSASREARRILNDDPGKLYYSFKEKAWLPTTLNRETVNVLRRRLTAGEITMTELTAVAA